MHMNKNINKLIQTARADRPADLLLRNARLINVFSGAIQQTHIAVADGYIAGFGEYEALSEVNLDGSYLSPGFIDAHVHIESSMVSPAQFARAVLPRGTTAVVADPHEIANVMGAQGLKYMLDSAEGQPFEFYFSLSSCVPATRMETSGAVLTAEQLKPFMSHPRMVALAEMMNYPGVIYEDPEVLAKISAMRSYAKPIDGHAPGLTGAQLNAYAAAGISSDHECISAEEAREKLAAGMRIMIRQGTGARNLKDLLPVINPQTARRIMWCTDDRHPHELLAEGHMDAILREAIGNGLDPILAIQMATLNPAEYFHLGDLGAIAPGTRADMVVFDDLQDLVVQQVYVHGQLTAEKGRLSPDVYFQTCEAPSTSMNVDADALDFRAPAEKGRLRVIELIPDQIITREQLVFPVVRNGLAVTDVSSDLLKLVVVERHHGSGRAGVGFIRGFGLKKGALASTVAHDSHNIIAVGVDDSDLQMAVRELTSQQGGMVVVAEAAVKARLPLPIAGLMSDQPVEKVHSGMDNLLAAARGLGTTMADPFMTLGFMALPVIPELKLSDYGLVDVNKFTVVSLFTSE
ncbi:MAG: adenine deaminase [Desulfobacteraceae bacterium]|nr:adenine deaminase [Desulfobacteraceae bacterium]